MTNHPTPTAAPILISILIFVTCASGCSSRADRNEDEYAVYAAVIEELSRDNNNPHTGAPANLLVIEDHTFVEADNYLFAKGSPDAARKRDEARDGLSQSLSISRATVEDFQARNDKSYELKDDFKPPLKYTLAPQSELEGMRREHRWEEFYGKYPASGGYERFSRVGLNPEMNQAVVYVEHWCEQWCGRGDYVTLKKEGEGWKVTEVRGSWVS